MSLDIIAFYGLAVQLWMQRLPCPPLPPFRGTRRRERRTNLGVIPDPTTTMQPPAPATDLLAPPASPVLHTPQPAASAQATMGAAYTAPADRGAGRQAGWRALSLYEADDALSERLGRLITMVRRLRIALHRHHGEESPLNGRLDALEEALIELELDVDHVSIRPYPWEIAGG